MKHQEIPREDGNNITPAHQRSNAQMPQEQGLSELKVDLEQFLEHLSKETSVVMFHRENLMQGRTRIALVNDNHQIVSSSLGSQNKAGWERFFDTLEAHKVTEASGFISRIGSDSFRYNFTPKNCFPSDEEEWTRITANCWVQTMIKRGLESTTFQYIDMGATHLICGFAGDDQYVLPVPVDPTKGLAAEFILHQVGARKTEPVDISWAIQ